MKRLLALSLPLMMQLSGCSAEITEYRQQQPTLDIFQYFQGETQAWGWFRIAAVNSFVVSMSILTAMWWGHIDPQ